MNRNVNMLVLESTLRLALRNLPSSSWEEEKNEERIRQIWISEACRAIGIEIIEQSFSERSWDEAASREVKAGGRKEVGLRKASEK